MAYRDTIVPESLTHFVESLQARGVYVFSSAQAQEALGTSEIATASAVRRLKSKGRIVAPRRGFFIIVPTEYRSAGAPPPSWFIDDLMRFMGQLYYVALLSAASLHGASHQQPMVFQVMTDRPTRKAQCGRSTIEFHAARAMGEVSTTEVATETGKMIASNPEATALDLVRYPNACGGWSNVATALGEMGDRIEPSLLRDAAQQRKTPEIQRLGYLLDESGQQRLADSLLRVLATRRVRPVLLDPAESATGLEPLDPWRVVSNVAVEPDL